MTTQQRCHVLDENWNVVAHFPEDALKHPHSGIADVALGDLDGDGKLKMYVGYLGTVGVQAVPVPPEGNRRLWSDRSMLNVGGMAIGRPIGRDAATCICTNNNGSLVVLDAEGSGAAKFRSADGCWPGSPPPISAATVNFSGAGCRAASWAKTWPSAFRSRATSFGATRCPRAFIRRPSN